MRHTVRFAMLLLAIFSLNTASALATPLSVEEYDTDHLDLEYLWISGAVDRPAFSSFPLSRDYMLRYLGRSTQTMQRGSYTSYLMNRMRSRLDPTLPDTIRSRNRQFFQWILQDMLYAGGFTRDLFRYNHDLYQWRDPERDLIVGARFIQRGEGIRDDSFRKGKTFATYGWGVEFWTALNGRFGSYVRFTDTTERGAGNHRDVYNDYAGYTDSNDAHTLISYDETTAWIGYFGDLFSTRIGRGKHAWGPGLRNHLMLGPVHSSYPFVDMTFNINDRFRFIYLHAKLSPETQDSLYTSAEGRERRAKDLRYYAAHRMEFVPMNWLTFGMSEAVIYGERGPELGYLVPVNLFWSEGHQQERDDNIMWSLDARLLPTHGVMLFGEFFIDEMNLGALFTEEFANRTAYHVGARVANFAGLEHHQAYVEYTRLRPFIYTHWFDINIPTHFGETMGAPIPPNSDELYLEYRFYPHNSLRLSLFHLRQRHGVTPEGDEHVVGGSIYESVLKNEGIYPFLAGDREDRIETGTELRWHATEILELFGEFATGVYLNEDYFRMKFGFHYRY